MGQAQLIASRTAGGKGSGEASLLSTFVCPRLGYTLSPPRSRAQRSMRHRSRHVEVMPAGGAAGSGTGGEAGDLEESSFVGWQAATAGPVIGGGGGDTSGGSAAAESAPGIGLGGSGKAVQPDGRAGAPAGARRSREQLLRLSGEGPGGNDSELPLPAHHLLRRPLATGGFNPLANAISIERPASPKVGVWGRGTGLGRGLRGMLLMPSGASRPSAGNRERCHAQAQALLANQNRRNSHSPPRRLPDLCTASRLPRAGCAPRCQRSSAPRLKRSCGRG